MLRALLFVGAFGPSVAASQRLQLANLHTGEQLAIELDGGRVTANETSALRHILRDYRVNEEHDMDPALFTLLTDLARAAAVPARYAIISGYRSPATNAKLRAAGHAVARQSQHMLGKAIDVRLQGCPLERLRDLALAAGRGGVGYYPRSNFIHLDTGRVRHWSE